MKDDDGKIVVEEDKLVEIWRAHYDKISKKVYSFIEITSDIPHMFTIKVQVIRNTAHRPKSNEQFAWDRNVLTNVSPVCGPCGSISALEVVVAIGKTKQGKSAGPTGIVAEMLKAVGETGPF